MEAIANELPYDVLLLIIGNLQDDYLGLFRCSLVNRAFNRAASKFLYRRVVLAPRYHPSIILSYENPIPSTRSNLTAATLPQYANLVEIVEIAGFLSSRPPPRNALPATIFTAIAAFKNLRVAILTPRSFHQDGFTEVLRYFASCSESSSDSLEGASSRTQELPPNLRELVVNPSCTDEPRAFLLVAITGLSKLTIHSPSRAILQLLPDWLRKLSHSLTELHLEDNCGSVTPGVLKSITPLLGQNVLSLSLGLSYSLTDEDVFTFLHQIPWLEKLKLRYYWQLKTPVQRPGLPRLQEFMVQHQKPRQRAEVVSLCKWIRRVISSSPIHTLRAICSDKDDLHSILDVNASYGYIVDHLCARHAGTLKVLDLDSAYIGVKPLKKLFKSCKELEEISLCAGRHALAIFRGFAPTLTKLHTASFDIRNVKLSKRHIVDMELITDILTRGAPSLRRLSVNERTWETVWERTEDGTFTLVVHEQHKVRPPWDCEPRPEPQAGISSGGRSGPRVRFR